ncbi:MAG: DUF1992 domain-containing protein [Desulfobacteraceae bacterium]|nr:DUF1992 domain-containing protein [Desulfobacteraceae bacterium]
MIPGFEAIVEERIRKAQQKGQMDDLPGEGRPLPDEEIDPNDEFRLAHKILKNAGFLPPEVEIRKKIYSTEQLLEAVAPDSPEQARLLKKLNFLMNRLSMARKSASPPALPSRYRNSILNRMS